MNKKINGFFTGFLCLAIFLGNIFFCFFPSSFALARENIRGEEILVKFKGDNEVSLLKVPAKEDIEDFLTSFREKEEVEYAEKNSSYRISLIPNDTYYNKQWYLKKIKAPEAWDKVREAPEIVIAIVDSGVQINHHDLAANIWTNVDEIPDNRIDDDNNGFIDDYNGWDFINNTPDPSPKFEDGFTEAGLMHGTIISGIVAASSNNGSGIAGITWRTKIMPLRVLDDKGEGRTSEVVRAIDYAIKNKADIINFSFVGFDYSQSLYEAIARAHQAGIIMVAAAGNEQEQGAGYNLNEVPMYPACHDGSENMVIGVAATDVVDQKTPFSSYGFRCVDISAPGVSFYSTIVYKPTIKNNGEFLDQYFGGYWSGTSMATPIISGTIALIEEINPEIEADEVKSILLDSTDNISRLNPDYLGQLGRGRVNIFKAVSLALEKLTKKTAEIIVAPYSDYLAQIKRVDKKGILISEFNAYEENFRGGTYVTSCDIDGNGEEEIITGAAFGGGPHVRMFSADGELIGQFFAYGEHFRGGVHIACGDINGDGKDEIITGAGNTGGPQVRIFDNQGRVLGQFFAYNENFRGGVNVAAGDINGDGKDEIITGAGPGGGPQVRIFEASGQVTNQFFAYNENFRGGVRVAVADIDGGIARKKDEIIVSPGAGGGPHIRIFSSQGKLLSQFFAYSKDFRGGVSIAAGDVDKDGLAEIVTGPGPSGGPHVRIFETDGALIGSFYGFADDFIGGINVGIISNKNNK